MNTNRMKFNRGLVLGAVGVALLAVSPAVGQQSHGENGVYRTRPSANASNRTSEYNTTDRQSTFVEPVRRYGNKGYYYSQPYPTYRNYGRNYYYRNPYSYRNPYYYRGYGYPNYGRGFGGGYYYGPGVYFRFGY